MKNLLLILIVLVFPVSAQILPFQAAPLMGDDDLSVVMVEGMNRYFDKKIEDAVNKRSQYRNVDFSSPGLYSRSMDPNRERLKKIIGAVDERLSVISMDFISGTSVSAKVAGNELFDAYAVRWNVFAGIHGEGLLLQPKGDIRSRLVVIPDADQIPEMVIGSYPGLANEMQYARRLAESGCQVIIPVPVNRSCELSGNERLNRFTNQPHREWVYRQAYTFGRHLIGYEVQKVLAAIDWFEQENRDKPLPVGIVGWGEGGLIGFYSAAVDTRIDAALISGYFQNRDNLWEEPIYRNLFGVLREFGDAEIAGMIAPRKLIIEYSVHPEVAGPPSQLTREGGGRSNNSAAPGRITTPSFDDVNDEFERAKKLSGQYGTSLKLISDGRKPWKPLTDISLGELLNCLEQGLMLRQSMGAVPSELRDNFDPDKRQYCQVKELESHVQQLIGSSRHVREDFFWNKMRISTPDEWKKNTVSYQKYFWDTIMGRITDEPVPVSPKSRLIYNRPGWKGYEVTFDVIPDLFVWGYLLLPEDIKPGEKRPVIVVMHGGGGVPSVVCDADNKTYKALAVQLVELGYIVFAPHFPWKQGDKYRNLQRKANPLGLSAFSLNLMQHDRMLDWLVSLPWVDSSKIGLYGLSWGGKVAMRMPALLNRYSLSVCSGDFNEWIWKNATTDWPNSYMFVPEYEMFDFDLGNTFGYGEMAALIAPRAFMVERGHNDGVGIDEWVAFEYAKVNRLYNKLNIPDNTEIEYFNGGHEINAAGTLKFIEKHFGLPRK
jgi:dienelactone hydrolase